MMTGRSKVRGSARGGARAVVAALVVCGAAACGGGAAAPGASSAADVRGAGMAQTFAGQNKCNPKSHERPFVIEWDATDMSSFESRAASDVVFVRYEGCDLQILETCSNDSVRGALGSYRPVEWTSGSLESLDIANEGELYAKLPLGAATLGGRVQGGEKFHMEYFVSGTRTATRDAVTRGELPKNPACARATHFVYAYNLGAFALGAQSNVRGDVGGSVWGFGGGGSRASQSKADKQGGVLASCRGESSKEVETCKVPIRLTLREIADGESADARDSAAPETPSAANLAGRLQATTAREKEAEEHGRTAETKLGARDGKGCLAELDAHDKLDPRPSGMSTRPVSYLSGTRARCLMLAGQCGPGKELFRKHLEATSGATVGPDERDKKTDGEAATYCQGGSMAARDQLLKARTDLHRGAFTETLTRAACASAYDTARRLWPTLKPRDDQDPVNFAPASLMTDAPLCLARAGDCGAAWTAFRDAWRANTKLSKASRRLDDDGIRTSFEAVVTKCKTPGRPKYSPEICKMSPTLCED